jgi:ATP synthase proteolipid subunit
MVLDGFSLAAIGAFLATALASLGGAIGIGFSGNAMIRTVAVKPESFSKGMISVVLAEALSIYGLLAAFMVIMRIDPAMPVEEGVMALASGLAIGLAGVGAGIGIASAGSALCQSLQYRPEVFSKALVSVVLAEALSIYGLLVSFIIIMRIGTVITITQAWVGVAAALTVGLGGLFAGLAIGWGGSAMTGAVEERAEVFSKSMVSVVLAEALAIYTLLVAFMLLMA